MSSDKVTLGRFGAAYSVRGWLHLISFTDPIDNILHYSTWLVLHHGKLEKLQLEQGKTHGKGLIVKIKQINDRELAREYTNDYISVPRASLPKTSSDEYYWQDLIGLTVITTNNVHLGKVKSLIATGANDVLIIAGERQRLIPYLSDTILNVDTVHQQIVVDWDPEF